MSVNSSLIAIALSLTVSSATAAHAATAAEDTAAVMPALPATPQTASTLAASGAWAPADAAAWRARLQAAGGLTPVPFLTITGEKTRISASAPKAYESKTRLRALTHLSPGAFDPDSLVITRGEHRYQIGSDVLLDKAWGGLGLAPGGTLDADTEVELAYHVSQRRIDALVRDVHGHEVIRTGIPEQLTPALPDIRAGDTLLARIFVDYRNDGSNAEILPILATAEQAPTATTGPERLPLTVAKLRAGQPVTIICWGDSVTAGGDVVSRQPYGEQLAIHLGPAYPKAKVWSIAVGGSNSRQWLSEEQPKEPRPAWQDSRFQRIIDAKPDLVVIEFVNDQYMNKTQALSHYTTIIDRLHALGAEVLLLTPQRNWERDGSLRATDQRGLVAAYRELGHLGAAGVGVADMAGRWEHLWREGIPFPALLANGFNHPDVRGHRLFYEEVCKALGIAP